MSDQTADGGAANCAANSTLAVMRDATRETAGTDAGGDSDGGAAVCPKCGGGFGNAGAAARHAKACTGAAEPEPKTENSGASEALAYEPADMEPREIAAVCEGMDADAAHATCESLGRESQDGDRIQHTASLALASEHPGVDGREAWVRAFGECSEPGCGYGSHGLDAEFCPRHEGASESADDADTDEGASESPEPEDSPDSEAVAAETKAEYVAGLVDAGMSPRKAAEAGEAVFGGDA